MKRLALIALLWCVQSAAAAGEKAACPDLQALRRYVLAEEKPKIDEARTAKLRAAMNEHVAEFISQPRWAPFHEWRGIARSGLSMTEPADVIYALSLAYPYVRADLKPKVKAYLAGELRQGKPHLHVDYPDLRKGAPRNYHRVDPADFARARADVLGPRRVPKLYPLCVLAENTGNWGLLKPIYPAIRQAAEAIPQKLTFLADPAERRDPRKAAAMAGNGRNLSSMVGFVRIAHHLGKTADSDSALKKLRSMVRRMLEIHRQIGRECLADLDAEARGEGHPSRRGQFRSVGGPYVGRTHHGMIVYWTDLCPQAGHILKAYAPRASDSVARWMLRNAQGFYLVRGDTPVQEGEVHAPWYGTTMNYFHVLSTIRQPDFDTHRLLVDAPACRADVYYLERLVRAIEASGFRRGGMGAA